MRRNIDVRVQLTRAAGSLFGWERFSGAETSTPLEYILIAAALRINRQAKSRVRERR